jgi:uncharacterized phage-like protein YoqJ
MAVACAFSGHRKIEQSLVPSVTEHLARAIRYAYDEGCRDFYCGGAVGFDTLAAREVIRFRMSHTDVRLVLYLPCINQDEKWSYRQSDAYEHILSSADEIKYISEEYTKSCMKERNQALADVADILIVYVGYSTSGSAQTARMGEKAGKRVFNLYPSVNGKIL